MQNDMEIFLQWLDDLDDLVFAVVYGVERFRWPCLKVGFTAACGLVVIRFADILLDWVTALVWTALASVMLWLTAVIVRELSGLAASSQRPPVTPSA